MKREITNAEERAACSPAEYCITCSDEARPASVVRVDKAACLALVVIDGDRSEVDISLVDEVHPHQVLLVHGGVALGHLKQA